MLRRLLSLVLLIWMLGFIGFAVTLPGPAAAIPEAAGPGSAVIVLTGAEGRIARGLDVLRRGWAPLMLVAGVDPEVQPREFAASYRIGAPLMQCCITLGTESVDTRSNAREARDWISQNHVKTIRLVTSDWHMRRAAWEFRQVLPPGVMLIEDAVHTRPSLNILFVEYCKLLAQRVAAGLPGLRLR
jgi:uncharacterized SAM-binding protein YcdF (DUF218 family)